MINPVDEGITVMYLIFIIFAIVQNDVVNTPIFGNF